MHHSPHTAFRRWSTLLILIALIATCVKAQDQVTVREGKVLFNERSVGSCHRITSGSVAHCDKKRYDNFDFGSQHRGEGQMYNGRVNVAWTTAFAAATIISIHVRISPVTAGKTK